MMREIGTMVIWNRHLLSQKTSRSDTRILLIIAQNTNPPQQSNVTILGLLERWRQQLTIVLISKIDLLKPTQSVKLESLWSCGLKEYLHTFKGLVCFYFAFVKK
jgi:hypothetical protein